MKNIALIASCGDVRIDTMLQEVIGVYEAAFPGRIAGYYVQGSYADETFVATSDIDLNIVFRNHFTASNEREAAHLLWERYQQTNATRNIIELDIGVVDEDSLQAGVHPTLKLGSRLIYGQNSIRSYPLMSIEAWARERMNAANWLMMHIYARSAPVDSSLDFPDPTDEFYGYVNRKVCLPDGRAVPSTRNLIRTTGWAATALLALQAGQYVVRKRDCHRLYRQYIGDEWSSLLEEIYTFCREEWHYLIPPGEYDRLRLRTICERTLSFERHFLIVYSQYMSDKHITS